MDLIVHLSSLGAYTPQLQASFETKATNTHETSTLAHIRDLLDSDLVPTCSHCKTQLLNKKCAYSQNQLSCNQCFTTNNKKNQAEELLFVEQQRIVVDLGAKTPGLQSWTLGDKLQFQCLCRKQPQKTRDSLNLVHLGKQMKSKKSSLQVLQYLCYSMNKEQYSQKYFPKKVNPNQKHVKALVLESIKNQEQSNHFEETALVDIFIKSNKSLSDFMISKISPQDIETLQVFNQLKVKENIQNIKIMLQILKINQENTVKNTKKDTQVSDNLEQITNTREEFQKNIDKDEDDLLNMQVYEAEIQRQFKQLSFKNSQMSPKKSRKIKKAKTHKKRNSNDI